MTKKSLFQRLNNFFGYIKQSSVLIKALPPVLLLVEELITLEIEGVLDEENVAVDVDDDVLLTLKIFPLLVPPPEAVILT